MSTKNILTTFKITSVKTGENRRFPATNSFAELKKNITCFWGEHPFVLTYLDEDGDIISVSTEFEFSEALSVANEMKMKVLKFNAYLNDDELKTHFNSSKKHNIPSLTTHNAIHHGVVCDRSGMNPIIGTRYHIPGADYDLCSNEYDKLTHDERSPYVKIESPGCHPIPCDPHYKHISSKKNMNCPRIIYGKSPYFAQQQRDGGCPFGRQGRMNQPPDMSVDDLMVQASLAASMFDNLNNTCANEQETKANSSPFAHVLGSFIDAAGIAAMKAATKHSEKNKKNENQAADDENKPNVSSSCNQDDTDSNPLTELFYGLRDEFLQNQQSNQQKTNPSGGGGGDNDDERNKKEKQKKEIQEKLRSQIRSKVKEHFQQFNEQQNENNSQQNPFQSHPLGMLLSSLINQNDNTTQPLKNEKGESIHHGVECDRSGMNPIIGIRYTIPNANYDLSQKEYDKLPENERLMFFKIKTPGETPIPCMQSQENEENEKNHENKENEKNHENEENEKDSIDSNDPTWTKVESKNMNPLSAEEPEDKEEAINEKNDIIYQSSKKTPETMKPKIVKVTPKEFVVMTNKKSSHKSSKDDSPPPVITLPNNYVKKVKKNSNDEPIENSDDEYKEQLIALANIGFIDRDTNLALLKRYQGRVDRVINYILENGTQIH